MTTPYTVTVGGVDYDVDAPDERTAWRWANQHHATATKARAEKTAQLEAQTRQQFAESEAARPLTERTLANIGAGMHSLYQGVAGIPRLFGADVGPTAEDVAESKRMKEQLAETTPGGKWIQLAGEVAPTLLIPAGGVGQVGARVLPGAARVLTRTLGPAATNIANIAGTGALVAGATTAGDLEERLKSGALAGVAGAALPAAMAVYRGVAPVLSRGAARGAEAERLAAELGPARTAEITGALAAPAPGRAAIAGVAEPTAAQITRDPMLQKFETASRVAYPEVFTAADEAAAKGRWERLGQIAQTPDALRAAEESRDAATRGLRESALDTARQVQGFDIPVAQRAVAIAEGEARTNPAVRMMTNYVLGELERGVTPEQLYSIRKTLTSSIPHGTELGSAVTQSRAERMALVNAIDDALDRASGGQWGEYMRTYQGMSAPITSMKAGQAIQKVFESAKRTGEDIPIMTAHKLRTALGK